MSLCIVALSILCWSCASHGKRVRALHRRERNSPVARAPLQDPPSRHAGVRSSLEASEALAKLLFSSNPATGFNPSGSGSYSSLGTPKVRSSAAVPTMAAGPAELKFQGVLSSSKQTVVVGRKASLLGDGIKSMLPAGCSAELLQQLVESIGDAGDDGNKASTLFTTPDGTAATLVAALLPEPCSRYASPIRPHAVTALVGSAVGSAPDTQVVAMLEEAAHAAGTACAIGRAFPLFSCRKAEEDQDASPIVQITFGDATTGLLTDVSYEACAAAAAGVRRAARLVDMPPDRLTTTQFVDEAKATAKRLSSKSKGIKCAVTSGEELRKKGYGLLYGVGKAAEEPPALVILSANAPPATADGTTKTICLVGKGIVYDTGGLALKSRDGMCGMKADCGGAAAMLGAFEAAVEIGLKPGTALHLVLCLAENAIGPTAVRLDDVISGVSGLTCEINNSDAEGRLVLADGVAHCTALPPRLPWLETQPDLIIDAATLTGAQMVATGKRHAAVIANTEEVEIAAVAAGKTSGDLVHPLPFAPEFYRKEFKSKVANMKNSVKDRSNAQTSCAANFIYEHLHPDYTGGWLHIDLAGPAFIDERGTGFGVGLALAMLGVEGFAMSGK